MVLSVWVVRKDTTCLPSIMWVWIIQRVENPEGAERRDGMRERVRWREEREREHVGGQTHPPDEGWATQKDPFPSSFLFSCFPPAATGGHWRPFCTAEWYAAVWASLFGPLGIARGPLFLGLPGPGYGCTPISFTKQSKFCILIIFVFLIHSSFWSWPLLLLTLLNLLSARLPFSGNRTSLSALRWIHIQSMKKIV